MVSQTQENIVRIYWDIPAKTFLSEMTLGTCVLASLMWLEETRVHCDNGRNKELKAKQHDCLQEVGTSGIRATAITFK